MKKKKPIQFTFIDGLLILLAGFLLSLAVFAVTEEKKSREEQGTYLVEASVFFEEPFAMYIPETGDVLYDEEGIPVGTIEEIVSDERKHGAEVLIRFRTEQPCDEGDFVLTTSAVVRRGTVLSCSLQAQEEE